MKKILAFILVVLVSIAFTIAQETGSNTNTGKTGTAEDTVTSVEKPGQNVSECMQGLLKKSPNMLREEAKSRCEFKNLKKLPLAKRIQEVKTYTKEQFLDAYKGGIIENLEKCETEECKERLQTRLEKLENLDEKFQLKLKKIEEKKLAIQERLNNLTGDLAIFIKEREFKARVLDKIKIEKARQNFLNAKEHFLGAQQKYRDAKLKFLEAKKAKLTCGAEECEEINKELLLHAKTYVLNAADAILNHLNTLKTKIESSEHLSEEEAGAMIEKIDAKIKEIEDAKLKIEQATTKEEFLNAVKVINSAWKKTKERITGHREELKQARMAGIIVRANNFELKINEIIERMTEKGKDISQIEPLAEQFSDKINEAKTHYDQAVAKFKEFKQGDKPEATEILNEAKNYFEEAREALKEAHKILQDIIKIVKESGGEEIGEVEEEGEEE